MEAEVLGVDDGSERQGGEEVDESLPDARVAVFALNFVVEAIGAREGSCLMVASEEEDCLGAQALENQQIADCFD